MKFRRSFAHHSLLISSPLRKSISRKLASASYFSGLLYTPSAGPHTPKNRALIPRTIQSSLKYHNSEQATPARSGPKRQQSLVR